MLEDAVRYIALAAVSIQNEQAVTPALTNFPAGFRMANERVREGAGGALPFCASYVDNIETIEIGGL